MTLKMKMAWTLTERAVALMTIRHLAPQKAGKSTLPNSNYGLELVNHDLTLGDNRIKASWN